MLVQTEQALPVDLYGWEEFPYLAGQKTRGYVESLGYQAELVISKFLGYDSPNPTHANAYYLVVLDVPDDQAEALKSILE